MVLPYAPRGGEFDSNTAITMSKISGAVLAVGLNHEPEESLGRQVRNDWNILSLFGSLYVEAEGRWMRLSGRGRMEHRGRMMRNIRAAVVLVCMGLSALVVPGCQSAEVAPKQQWSHQPIESFGSIAGKWDGLMVRSPKVRGDDWVRVTIADDGRCEFASYRTIGAFSGRGQFTLAEGKLTLTTGHGTVTGSLYVSDNSRVLRMSGVMEDGTRYAVQLQPSQ